MMVIEFRDPTPEALERKRGVRSDLESARAALIERSGEWAVIKKYSSRGSASVLAARIRKSEYLWSGETWESVYQPEADGTYLVFARHISKDS